MKLSEIYAVIDKIAPFDLSREYCDKFGAYDNSGILVDCGEEIESVLFSLDCSASAVAKAKELGANLLITHHPAIYAPIKALTAANPVTACVKSGISIISAHLNLDCARGGIDDSLALALGAKGEVLRMHTLSAGGYGSVFNVSKTPLESYLEGVKQRFGSERVVCYGQRAVARVASYCGAGLDEESIAFAYASGADTIVSSDPKHHLVAMAVEKGMNAIILTHYAAENYGFKKFYQTIKEKCSLASVKYFTDERLM